MQMYLLIVLHIQKNACYKLIQKQNLSKSYLVRFYPPENLSPSSDMAHYALIPREFRTANTANRFGNLELVEMLPIHICIFGYAEFHNIFG